ncbi:unnamed protein product [Effrenium voratum]|nr:unnamed protein product [Effrenium voratum]
MEPPSSMGVLRGFTGNGLRRTKDVSTRSLKEHEVAPARRQLDPKPSDAMAMEAEARATPSYVIDLEGELVCRTRPRSLRAKPEPQPFRAAQLLAKSAKSATPKVSRTPPRRAKDARVPTSTTSVSELRRRRCPWHGYGASLVTGVPPYYEPDRFALPWDELERLAALEAEFELSSEQMLPWQ